MSQSRELIVRAARRLFAERGYSSVSVRDVAAEAGVSALLRRSEASPERMAQVIGRVAGGEAEMPPDLLARLLGQVGKLQRQILAPRGLTFSGLTEREIEVLRLVAKGLSYKQVAERLVLSHRTVQNHVQNTLRKLQLHNRVQLVRYAIDQGLDDEPLD